MASNNLYSILYFHYDIQSNIYKLIDILKQEVFLDTAEETIVELKKRLDDKIKEFL